MTYHSDLDIIFIYTPEGETTGGRQRLTNQEYFARLAARILSALGTSTREGYAYRMDTRLRPSGTVGPLVTSLAGFEAYHRGSSQIWERQALTRARCVVGAPALQAQVAALVQEFAYGQPWSERIPAEMARLRQRMETELAHEGGGRRDVKLGRGGLVDVEFLVQLLQLHHGGAHPAVRVPHTGQALAALARVGVLGADEHQTLWEAYRFLGELENRLRLVHDRSIHELEEDPSKLGTDRGGEGALLALLPAAPPPPPPLAPRPTRLLTGLRGGSGRHRWSLSVPTCGHPAALGASQAPQPSRHRGCPAQRQIGSWTLTR